MANGIDVLVVGLGFGRHFVPIYQAHPSVGRVGVVDPSSEALDWARSAGVASEDCFTRLEDALATSRFDAVHLLSPVPFHVDQTVAVLDSGRHCACAVPMATSLEGLQRVVDAVDRSGRTYMMMETSVFAREYFLARDLLRDGVLGRLTFYRGEHLQNLDGFPHYWLGYPPMLYLTHALSPILELAGARVESVTCRSSSALTPDHVGPYGPGGAVQTGLFQLRADTQVADADLVANITTSFFQLGRGFYEGFSVYGDEGSLEWPQGWDEPMRLWRLRPHVPGDRGRHGVPELVEPPERPDLVPPELAGFCGGDHGGSHPHLVHEFVSSIVHGRQPLLHARRAAELVAPGIVANQSSHQQGETLPVPSFT